MKNYALITGASKGIGKLIAIELAKRGYNLLLVARSEQGLQTLQAEIKKRFALNVDYLVLDLSLTDSSKEIVRWIEAKPSPVSVLVNNAGYGLYGEFSEQNLEDQVNMLQLNIISLTQLTHLMIPLLAQKQPSYILNIASTAAYQAVPYMSAYAASKAYVLSFSRALRYELKGTGISVSCLSPGPVKTEFWKRAKTPVLNTVERLSMIPEKVAKLGVRELFKGKAEIIAGPLNLIGAVSGRFLPKGFVEKFVGRLFKR